MAKAPRIKTSKLITDEIVSLAESGLSKTNSLKNKLKLQAIISAKKYGIKSVAEIYNISHISLNRWVHRLRKESLEGLNPKPKRARSAFTLEQKKIIENWLSSDNNITVRPLRDRIEKELGLKVGKTAVHRLIHRLGFDYVKPRGNRGGKKQSSPNYCR